MAAAAEKIGADPTVLFPPASQVKVRALDTRSDDFLATARFAQTKLSEMRERFERHHSRARELAGPAWDCRESENYSAYWTSWKDRNADRADAVKLELDAAAKLQVEILYQAEIVAARTRDWNEASRLVSSAKDFALKLPSGFMFKAADAIEPKLGKNETLANAIEAKRRYRRELIAEQDRVSAAPWPAARANEVLRQRVEALAERGRPDVFRLLEERGGEIEFPTKMVQHGVVFVHEIDSVALIAYLHRDLLIDRLEKEVEALADPDAALTDVERAERQAEITRDLLFTEREEVALIDRANASGGNFSFRTDTDVRALLGLADAPVPRKEQPQPYVSQVSRTRDAREGFNV